MPRIIESPSAEEDIAAVLAFTLEQWGPTKYWEYRDLIEEAYDDILTDSECGRLRMTTRPGVCGHFIKKPGRNARHIVFYRATNSGDIEVIRFLHDAMDHKRHI